MCEQSVLNVLNLEEKKSKYGSPASYPKRKEDLKILLKISHKKKRLTEISGTQRTHLLISKAVFLLF